jgi:hypothetical protein
MSYLTIFTVDFVNIFVLNTAILGFSKSSMMIMLCVESFGELIGSRISLAKENA